MASLIYHVVVVVCAVSFGRIQATFNKATYHVYKNPPIVTTSFSTHVLPAKVKGGLPVTTQYSYRPRAAGVSHLSVPFSPYYSSIKYLKPLYGGTFVASGSSNVGRDFQKIATELRKRAPGFCQLLSDIMNTTEPVALVSSAAILLHHRNQNMSLIHHVVGQLLDYGGATDEFIYQEFYKPSSSFEQGTLFQLRNVIHRVDVTGKERVVEAFRAHFAFVEDALDAFILGAAMDVMGLEDINGFSQQFNPNTLSLFSAEDQFSWLKKLAEAIIDKHINLQVVSPRTYPSTRFPIYRPTFQPPTFSLSSNNDDDNDDSTFAQVSGLFGRTFVGGAPTFPPTLPVSPSGPYNPGVPGLNSYGLGNTLPYPKTGYGDDDDDDKKIPTPYPGQIGTNVLTRRIAGYPSQIPGSYTGLPFVPPYGGRNFGGVTKDDDDGPILRPMGPGPFPGPFPGLPLPKPDDDNGSGGPSFGSGPGGLLPKVGVNDDDGPLPRLGSLPGPWSPRNGGYGKSDDDDKGFPYGPGLIQGNLGLIGGSNYDGWSLVRPFPGNLPPVSGLFEGTNDDGRTSVGPFPGTFGGSNDDGRPSVGPFPGSVPPVSSLFGGSNDDGRPSVGPFPGNLPPVPSLFGGSNDDGRLSVGPFPGNLPPVPSLLGGSNDDGRPSVGPFPGNLPPVLSLFGRSNDDGHLSRLGFLPGPLPPSISGYDKTDDDKKFPLGPGFPRNLPPISSLLGGSNDVRQTSVPPVSSLLGGHNFNERLSGRQFPSYLPARPRLLGGSDDDGWSLVGPSQGNLPPVPSLLGGSNDDGRPSVGPFPANLPPVSSLLGGSNDDGRTSVGPFPGNFGGSNDDKHPSVAPFPGNLPPASSLLGGSNDDGRLLVGPFPGNLPPVPSLLGGSNDDVGRGMFPSFPSPNLGVSGSSYNRRWSYFPGQYMGNFLPGSSLLGNLDDDGRSTAAIGSFPQPLPRPLPSDDATDDRSNLLNLRSNFQQSNSNVFVTLDDDRDRAKYPRSLLPKTGVLGGPRDLAGLSSGRDLNFLQPRVYSSRTDDDGNTVLLSSLSSNARSGLNMYLGLGSNRQRLPAYLFTQTDGLRGSNWQSLSSDDSSRVYGRSNDDNERSLGKWAYVGPTGPGSKDGKDDKDCCGDDGKSYGNGKPYPPLTPYGARKSDVFTKTGDDSGYGPQMPFNPATLSSSDIVKLMGGSKNDDGGSYKGNQLPFGPNPLLLSGGVGAGSFGNDDYTSWFLKQRSFSKKFGGSVYGGRGGDDDQKNVLLGGGVDDNTKGLKGYPQNTLGMNDLNGLTDEQILSGLKGLQGLDSSSVAAFYSLMRLQDQLGPQNPSGSWTYPELDSLQNLPKPGSLVGPNNQALQGLQGGSGFDDLFSDPAVRGALEDMLVGDDTPKTLGGRPHYAELQPQADKKANPQKDQESYQNLANTNAQETGSYPQVDDKNVLPNVGTFLGPDASGFLSPGGRKGPEYEDSVPNFGETNFEDLVKMLAATPQNGSRPQNYPVPPDEPEASTVPKEAEKSSAAQSQSNSPQSSTF